MLSVYTESVKLLRLLRKEMSFHHCYQDSLIHSFCQSQRVQQKIKTGRPTKVMSKRPLCRAAHVTRRYTPILKEFYR